MFLYHYTSFSNWKKIRKEGLVPQELHHVELDELYYPDSPPPGIWLWKNTLKGVAHTGSVIYQVVTKNDSKVVLLRVEVDKEDLLHFDNRLVHLYHEGRIEKFIYHHRVRGFVCTRVIRPVDIEPVEIYDIIERLQ